MESQTEHSPWTKHVLSGGRWLVLLVVAGGWLSILGGRYLFPVLLPSVQQSFGLSATSAGIAITVLWGAYALIQFPAGALTDRLGERTLLTTSLLVAAGAIVGVSVAPTFGAFVVGCGLFGLASGLYGPARGTVLSKTFGSFDGTAIGIVLAIGSIGSAVIPLLGSQLLTSFHWRTVVLVLVVPLSVVGGGIWLVIDAPASPTTARTSTIPSVSTLFGALTRRSVLVGTTAATVLLFVLQGLTAFLPVYYVRAGGVGQSTAALLYALFFTSGAVFQSLGGTLADRFGDPAVLRGVTVVASIGLFVLPFVSGPLPLAIVTLLLSSRLAINSVSNAYLIDSLPADNRATVWGLLRTVFFLVGATGSTVVGFFFDHGYESVAMYGLGGLTAVGTVLYLFLPQRTDVATAEG